LATFDEVAGVSKEHNFVSTRDITTEAGTLITFTPNINLGSSRINNKSRCNIRMWNDDL